MTFPYRMTIAHAQPAARARQVVGALLRQSETAASNWSQSADVVSAAIQDVLGRSKHDRPWHEYAFATIDAMVLTPVLIVPHLALGAPDAAGAARIRLPLFLCLDSVLKVLQKR
jgi:hypothetical protein